MRRKVKDFSPAEEITGMMNDTKQNLRLAFFSLQCRIYGILPEDSTPPFFNYAPLYMEALWCSFKTKNQTTPSNLKKHHRLKKR